MNEQIQFAVAPGPEGGQFKVVDAEGRTQLVCADAADADQYAVLMNQSYQRGFKAGYRQARRAGRGAESV